MHPAHAFAATCAATALLALGSVALADTVVLDYIDFVERPPEIDGTIWNLYSPKINDASTVLTYAQLYIEDPLPWPQPNVGDRGHYAYEPGGTSTLVMREGDPLSNGAIIDGTCLTVLSDNGSIGFSPFPEAYLWANGVTYSLADLGFDPGPDVGLDVGFEITQINASGALLIREAPIGMTWFTNALYLLEGQTTHQLIRFDSGDTIVDGQVIVNKPYASLLRLADAGFVAASVDVRPVGQTGRLQEALLVLQPSGPSLAFIEGDTLSNGRTIDSIGGINLVGDGITFRYDNFSASTVEVAEVYYEPGILTLYPTFFQQDVAPSTIPGFTYIVSTVRVADGSIIINGRWCLEPGCYHFDDGEFYAHMSPGGTPQVMIQTGDEIDGRMVTGLDSANYNTMGDIAVMATFGSRPSLIGHALLRISPPVGALCTGDANTDGLVNTGDLLILLSNFNQPGGFSQGDFSGDGVVDTGDLLALLAAFNTVCL